MTAAGLGRHLSIRLILGIAFVLELLLVVGVGALVTTSSNTTSPEPQPPTRAERLIAVHHCWTGDGPAGVIPGHAVVTLPGEQARYVKSDVGFGIWLHHKPGTLHAFCR